MLQRGAGMSIFLERFMKQCTNHLYGKKWQNSIASFSQYTLKLVVSFHQPWAFLQRALEWSPFPVFRALHYLLMAFANTDKIYGEVAFATCRILFILRLYFPCQTIALICEPGDGLICYV